jgi:hypothetical protein
MSASLAAAAAAPALATEGAGHGAHGLGSPRFARAGLAVVCGDDALPAAARDHIGAPSAAFAVAGSHLPGE